MPHEAWRTAEAWRRRAETTQGAERDRALVAHAQWSEHSRRLAAVQNAPVPAAYGAAPWHPRPVQGPLTATPTAPSTRPTAVAPVALVQAPVPGVFPAAGHVPVPQRAGAPTGPVWPGYGGWPPPGDGRQQYPGPGYAPPPPRRFGNGAIVVIVVASIVAIVGIPVSVVMALRSFLTNDSSSGNVALVDMSANGTTTGSGLEAEWRAGDGLDPLPEIPPSPAVPFLDDYADPTDWLVSAGVVDVEVIVTDDPEFNCGYADVDSEVVGAFGGCFTPRYPRTLFVYWESDTVPAQRQFLVAHEYSHLIQWWDKFDLMYSGAEDPDIDEDAWTAAVESDASCRVLSWGGYAEWVADGSSAPCTATDWDEDWLRGEAVRLGVEIQDY